MSWFDALIAIIVVLSLIRGFISGFVKQIASLLGIVAGMLFAGQLSLKLKPHLHKIINPTLEHMLDALSYIIAFCIILFVFYFLGLVIQKMLKILQLNILNHILGSFLCPAKWLIIISILLNIVLTIDINQRLIKPDVREKSLFYPYIKSITSYFIPFLDFDKSKEE